MTTPNQVRSLKALDTQALDLYESARFVHRRHWEAWRKHRHLYGDTDDRTQEFLKSATEAAMHLHNAKRQHQAARLELRLAEKQARRAGLEVAAS